MDNTTYKYFNNISNTKRQDYVIAFLDSCCGFIGSEENKTLLYGSTNEGVDKIYNLPWEGAPVTINHSNMNGEVNINNIIGVIEKKFINDTGFISIDGSKVDPEYNDENKPIARCIIKLNEKGKNFVKNKKDIQTSTEFLYSPKDNNLLKNRGIQQNDIVIIEPKRAVALAFLTEEKSPRDTSLYNVLKNENNNKKKSIDFNNCKSNNLNEVFMNKEEFENITNNYINELKKLYFSSNENKANNQKTCNIDNKDEEESKNENKEDDKKEDKESKNEVDKLDEILNILKRIEDKLQQESKNEDSEDKKENKEKEIKNEDKKEDDKEDKAKESKNENNERKDNDVKVSSNENKNQIAFSNPKKEFNFLV